MIKAKDLTAQHADYVPECIFISSTSVLMGFKTQSYIEYLH